METSVIFHHFFQEQDLSIPAPVGGRYCLNWGVTYAVLHTANGKVKVVSADTCVILANLPQGKFPSWLPPLDNLFFNILRYLDALMIGSSPRSSERLLKVEGRTKFCNCLVLDGVCGTRSRAPTPENRDSVKVYFKYFFNKKTIDIKTVLEGSM